MRDELLQKALNLCYYYLKFRPRTEREIREYLKRKAQRFRFDDDVMTAALEELKNQGLINDADFVRWYVQGKLTTAHRSLAFVRSSLIKLGIPKLLLSEYLEREHIDDEGAAHEALAGRWKRWILFDPRTRQRKALQFLTGRGFSYSTAKKALESVRNEADEQ